MLVLLFGILFTMSKADSGDFKESLPKPQLRVSPDVITEGTNVTLTCHSDLLHKDTTLEFGLYWNGFISYIFSKDNTWHIYSFKKEFCGNYTCGVNSSTSPKDIIMSDVVNIQINDWSSTPAVRVSPNVTPEGSGMSKTYNTPTSPGVTSEDSHVIFMRRTGQTKPPSDQSNADVPLAIAVNENPASSEQQPPPGAPPAEQDVCYTYIDINHLQKTSSAPPLSPIDNDVTYSLVMPKKHK
ncbi:FL3 precursor [Xenopus laevis]|uniref:FL3 n=1 Tax=Xenopus laevis TaxID=8355 RepID=Q4VWT1_XENLA|nr:FL3 precursor [Xenopus laevis]AAQ63875.1 FL3 [Xenopus laevis]